jgi:hypothetical protein
MKTAGFIVALNVALLLFSSCAFTPSSPEPEKVEESPLDHYWHGPKNIYPMGGGSKILMPFAEGQYVVTGTTINGKHSSVSRTLVVKKEKNTWITETTTIDENGKEESAQHLILGYEELIQSGDTTKFRLVWMKTRDESGKIIAIEGRRAKKYSDFLEKGMADRAHDFNSVVEGGPIEVPAGKFGGSLYSSKKITHENGPGFLDEAWRNVAVPIDGIVKRKITNDTGETTTYELLSFGFDGTPKLQFGSQ